MKNVKAVVTDLCKIFIVGILSAIGITILLFLLGFIIGSSGIKSGIEVAKNGTLILSSLALFILAGMIITKGKKTGKVIPGEGWRKHFRMIGYKTTVGVVGISFILIASIMDLLQMYLH